MHNNNLPDPDTVSIYQRLVGNEIKEEAPAAKLRIFMLLTQMEAGGAQSAAIKLAIDLETLGHHVTIGAMYDKGAYVATFGERFGLDMIDLKLASRKDSHRLKNLYHFCTGLGRLWKILRDKQYDVLLTFTHFSNILGPIVGWIAGVPIRISSQRSLPLSYAGWVKLLDRLVTNSRLVDKMTAVSDAVRNGSIEQERIRPHKIETIYTGLNVELYCPNQSIRDQIRAELGLNDKHIVITNVARLHPIKGHNTLLAAIPKVLDAKPECRFLFIGDGPIIRSLSEQIVSMDLENFVYLLGNRDDVPRLLVASDILVLSSLEEGLPNVILEGMAAGLAIVATDVGGVPELVSPNTTGLLVPHSDANALADAITQLASNPKTRAVMGERGRLKVSTEFTSEKTTTAYIDLITEIQIKKDLVPNAKQYN